MDINLKIKELEEKLAKYEPMYVEAKLKCRGVKHENSLSELRYTQFMVYQDMVMYLKKEIADLRLRLKTVK